MKFGNGLFKECNHNIDLKAADKIYINSPYYPDYYPIGSSCRYSVRAPVDHVLKLKCSLKLKMVC